MKVKRRRADKEDRSSQKRNKTGKRRKTKKKQKRKRKKLCSTSPPGGNQVDGLPPVPHTATVAIHNRPGRRKSVNLTHSFDCVVVVLLMT